jgi:hypothetical protein
MTLFDVEKEIIVEDKKKDEELNKPALLDSHIVIIKRLCGRELFKEIQMIRFPKSEKPVVDDLGRYNLYVWFVDRMYICIFERIYNYSMIILLFVLKRFDPNILYYHLSLLYVYIYTIIYTYIFM